MRGNAEAWQPGERVGDVTIVSRVAEGQGSFGVLHLVETGDGERLVLKSLNSEHRLDADWTAKYRREIALHIRLSEHPHVVTCHGSFEAFGSPHLLMEYCELGTLHALIASAGTGTEVGVVALILCDVCSALEAVHEAGYVYGDLNPLNVLLDGSLRRPRAKLTDFGVAFPVLPRILQDDEKPIPDTPGEKHSTAPEAYRGMRQPSNDVYAVGILGYGLATGDVPYDVEASGLSPSELRARFMELHICADIPNPRALRSDLPIEIGDVIMACMAKRPEDRPASVHEVCSRLLPFASP